MLLTLAKNYQFFSAVDLESLNLSITTDIKDLLTLVIQQVREPYTPNICTQKQTLIVNLSNIICDKDLVLENQILKVKLEESGKENTFPRGEVKDLTVLLNSKI